jgi:S-adenosylmethionine-diacylglycerol 3-amino-3-carboxypropyl transferase
VYLNGRYSRDYCPLYLKPENFEFLSERLGRIHPHTMKLSDFLRFTQERFSVYVLLDHMDWMRGDTLDLSDEWRLILNTAIPAARIIFRSGALSFKLPDFAQRQLTFHSELARSLHQQDRVGTYGSFYFATLGA